MTPTQRDDLIAELREYLPMVVEHAADTERDARQAAIYPTTTFAEEPEAVRAARLDVVAAGRALAKAHDRYAQSIHAAIRHFQGER